MILVRYCKLVKKIVIKMLLENSLLTSLSKTKKYFDFQNNLKIFFSTNKKTNNYASVYYKIKNLNWLKIQTSLVL